MSSLIRSQLSSNFVLSSDPEGKVRALFGGRENCAKWDVSRHQDDEGEYFNFKAWNGKFLSATPRGNVAANREVASTWEQWKAIEIENGFTLLRSFHGDYLCVKETIPKSSHRTEEDYFCAREVHMRPYLEELASWSICSPTVLGMPGFVGHEARNEVRESVGRETRGVVPNGEAFGTGINPELENRPVYIRSRRTQFDLHSFSGLSRLHSHPALTSWPDGVVKGNRFGQAKKWEEWEISRLADACGDYVTIKAWTGKFLSASPNGTVTATREKARAWEWWTVTVDEEGFTAFQSFHGGYLSNYGDWDSVGEVLHLSPRVGPREKWSITDDSCALTSQLSMAELQAGFNRVSSLVAETGAVISGLLDGTSRSDL